MPRKPYKYEYKIVWRYPNSGTPISMMKQSPKSILHKLRWLATDQPWLGAGKKQFKRAWFQLSKHLGVPFADVQHMGAKEAIVAMRAIKPKVDWVRVEMRQVGEWHEMLDPLTMLRGPGTVKSDAKQLAMMAEIDAMTPEQLDAFRWVPSTIESDVDYNKGKR